MIHKILMYESICERTLQHLNADLGSCGGVQHSITYFWSSPLEVTTYVAKALTELRLPFRSKAEGPCIRPAGPAAYACRCTSKDI